jgi:hypothetical protein
MGNNRDDAVISYQIEIMITAATDSVARTGTENVEEDADDIGISIHNQRKRSQANDLTLQTTDPSGSDC